VSNSAIITRRRDPLARRIKEVRDHPGGPFIFVEGPRLLEEVLRSGLAVETLIEAKNESPKAEPVWLSNIRASARHILKVSDDVFRMLSDVEEPQGLAAVCKCPRWTWQELLEREKRTPLVILDGLQNPGNVAAVARTAEAAGMGGIITTAGTAHLFSPKALRASMGSCFRLPSLEHQPVKVIIEKLAEYRFLGTAVNDSSKTIDYTAADWTPPLALVLGQEGQGIRPEWDGHIRQSLHIPMESPVESLNVSAAAALIFYEIKRGSLRNG
jgi:TrmH family RNA methyltransferase